MELTQLNTYTAADLGVEEALSKALSANPTPSERQAVEQIRRFMPDNLTRAQYADATRREWDVIVGDYGSRIKAASLWLVLRGLAASEMKSVETKNGTALWSDSSDGRILVLQVGGAIAGVKGPKGADIQTLTTLAGSLTN